MYTKFFGVFIVTAFALSCGLASAHAQASRAAEDGYSESGTTTRSRSVKAKRETSPSALLHAARTIYLEPEDGVEAEYLAYKLGKYPDFEQWKLHIVTDRDKADLVLKIHQKALNYIFSIEDQESSIVVANGKTIAINDLIATDQIAKEIIKRLQSVRALPTDERE
ncbi:MAG: hypothetical protein JO360_10025 [Acidobacteria bacterium]|nr:hypothetical protein [Acidobacteriota bacterium]